MKKYLIIGGLGFVGKNLARHLLGQNDFVTVFDIRKPNKNELSLLNHDNISFIKGDVLNESQLDEVFKGGFDGVYHLASFVGIKNYISNPVGVISTTIEGTKIVAEKCIQHNCHLFFTSTSEVLGRNTDVPWKEDADRVYGSTMKDRWSYGSSKGVAEQIIIGLSTTRGLSYTISRFFNIYGEHQSPIFVVPKTIHNCLNSLSPLIYDSGAQTRCFTYVQDAVIAVDLLMKKKSVGIFHIGSNFEHSMQEVVDNVIRLVDVELIPERIDTEELYSGKYEDIDRRVPDVTKIYNEIGWKATTSLVEGLSNTINWARESDWWLASDSSISDK